MFTGCLDYIRPYGVMAQQFGALAALAGDLTLVPSTRGSSQSLGTPAAGDPCPLLTSTGTSTHTFTLHMSTHTHESESIKKESTLVAKPLLPYLQEGPGEVHVLEGQAFVIFRCIFKEAS